MGERALGEGRAPGGGCVADQGGANTRGRAKLGGLLGGQPQESWEEGGACMR